MDTQYYTTATSTPVLALEEYQDIPSKHINGDRDKFSEVASRLVDIDLKLIYHAFREAIRKDRRGDEVGRVYTVSYKIYYIQSRHHYMPFYENHYYGSVLLHGHSHMSLESDLERQITANLISRGITERIYNIGCMYPYMDYTPRTLEEIIRSAHKNWWKTT